MKAALFALLVATALSGRSDAFAGTESCGGNYWAGSLPEHEVDSISADGLQQFLDEAPIIDGIKFEVALKGDELWLDIVEYPGEVTAIASIRTILVIGRLVKPQYQKLVLADNGEGVFEVSYAELHRIGCQFVWSVEGGQNPIALNRDLADALRRYPDGARVAPPFNGSLLGDTSAMLTTFNKIVYPEWLLKTVTIK